MQALVCRKLGDPTVPISETSPIFISQYHPVPLLTSPTSVLIRIKAVSVNYGTVLQLMGKYQEKPPLPFVPGSDFSGVVEKIGNGVTRVKVGDMVCVYMSTLVNAQTKPTENWVEANNSNNPVGVRRIRNEAEAYARLLQEFAATKSPVQGYSRHGSMNVARRMFDEMSGRDTLSWNTLIAGYAHNGDGEKALEVFCQMNVDRDRSTFASVLKDMLRMIAGRRLLLS